MADWVCACSGDCCRGTATVQMSETEWEGLRAARPEVEPVVVRRAGARLEIAAGPCPYLGADARCTVYAVRPWGCRVFGCFRRSAGDGASMTDRLQASAGARRVWRRMLTEAEAWGRAHGWLDEHGDPR